MNLKRILVVFVCVSVAVSMSSCTIEIKSGKSKNDVSSESSFVSSEAASDDSEDVVWIGSDEVGWLAVDNSFYKFYDPDVSDTCVQYATSPYDILTLDVGENCDAETAASIRLSLLQDESESENIDGITGAKVKVGDKYDAFQVYCYYVNDQQFLVMWFIDAPSENKFYYIAAEFRATNSDFINYVETYKMPE